MTHPPDSAPPPPNVVPLLPLRNNVLFPQLMMPLVVQHPRRIAAVLAALASEEKVLAISAQRNADLDEPTFDDIYPIGSLAVIKKMARADNALQIVVQGTARARLTPADCPAIDDSVLPFPHHQHGSGSDGTTPSDRQPGPTDGDSANPNGADGDGANRHGSNQDDKGTDSSNFDEDAANAPSATVVDTLLASSDGDADGTLLTGEVFPARNAYLCCRFDPIPAPTDWAAPTEAMFREVLELAHQVVQTVNAEAEPAFRQMLSQTKQPLQQLYLLSTLLSLDVEQEQGLLAAATLADAVEKMHQHLSHEKQVLQIRQEISSQVQTELNSEQRRFVLRKQLEAIQDELGEQTPDKADVEELRRKLSEAKLPESIEKPIDRELGRLERLPTASPDYQVTRSYLELVAELPWSKSSQVDIDLRRAQQVLDEDHYDLVKIKERIIEHLAVQKLNPRAKSPILCFVGPPGVGKTSLGRSIARAVGREFSRISLGGLHDESELRGHRRTYIGAMPGRIIQSLRQAEVNNPLVMLDEVDKLGHDFRGDPAAALLEILDPGQNHDFRDNYLDLPFDLSQVFFIATANTLDTIPGPLMDRLEIIRLSGYTDADKLQIARRYLVPRQVADCGLTDEQITLTDEALKQVIRHYTREAGVRQLDRAIGSLCRKIAKQFALGNTTPVKVDSDDVAPWLGRIEFDGQSARTNLPMGVAAGLAWTPAGGDLLYVESVMLPEESDLRITGQLGDVMKESARTAQSYVSSRWAELDLDKRALRSGVHIHVPAGATPKDGPSAGVTIATALTSLYTTIPVREDVAMTGEITLSGLVLPVGGIREKVLAAHRGGITTVLLPRQNEKDLDDVNDAVRDALQIILCDTVDDVLAAAIPQLEPRLSSHV